MAEKLEIYKCDTCGNIVMVMHGGKGELVCCGQPMKLFKENTVDAAKEKHVPVIEKKSDGCIVNVGDVDHPMEDKHYIEWIEIVDGDKSYIQFLKPGDKPRAEFKVNTDNIGVRAYCNLHGLWKA